MDVIIRKASGEDAEKILEFTKIVGTETDNLSYGSEGIGVTIEQEQKMLDNNEGNLFLVAVDNNRIIGIANISRFKRRMSHRAEIGLSVLKEFWGQGIGSRLLEELIKFAKNNNIEIINLEVRSDNISAIKLYEKYGFIKTGTLNSFLKINNEYYDFDTMYLDLR